MAGQTVRTIADLPVKLVKAAAQAVLDGKAKSRNDVLNQALRHELPVLERSAIDAAFAGMADDEDYQAEARNIAEQFVNSDRESLHSIQESA